METIKMENTATSAESSNLCDPFSVPKNPIDTADLMPKQTNLSSRYELLINNPYQSDVKFIFDDGQNFELYAHKLIAGAGSTVFCTMFDEENWTKNNTDGKILISDINSDIFKELIYFIYTHKTLNLNETNAFDILSAAIKYKVFGLEAQVINYLSAKMTVENVCEYYRKSFIFDNILTKRAKKMIQQQTKEVFQTESFKVITLDTLKEILNFSPLSISEDEVFRFMLIWGLNACKRNEIPTSIENIRNILDGAEKLIRFPTMDIEAFIICTKMLKRQFFTNEEMGEIFYCITTKNLTDVPVVVGQFSTIPRGMWKEDAVFICRTSQAIKRAKF